ncbi:hypothetical protein BC826DRAFT_120001 [Russula brevipes]|nr:hypothetical protein BC826DRAFT_120001 [Russula brevipes]
MMSGQLFPQMALLLFTDHIALARRMSKKHSIKLCQDARRTLIFLGFSILSAKAWVSALGQSQLPDAASFLTRMRSLSTPSIYSRGFERKLFI